MTEEIKEAHICLLCRYLIDKIPGSGNYLTFGDEGLQTIICCDCLLKIKNFLI